MNLLTWNAAVAAQGVVAFVVIVCGGLALNRWAARGRAAQGARRCRVPAVSFALALVGAVLVTPLVLIVTVLGLTALVVAAHVWVVIPFTVETVNTADGTSLETGPLFGVFALLVATAVTTGLYRLDRRAERRRRPAAELDGAPAKPHPD